MDAMLNNELDQIYKDLKNNEIFNLNEVKTRIVEIKRHRYKIANIIDIYSELLPNTTSRTRNDKTEIYSIGKRDIMNNLNQIEYLFKCFQKGINSTIVIMASNYNDFGTIGYLNKFIETIATTLIAKFYLFEIVVETDNFRVSYKSDYDIKELTKISIVDQNVVKWSFRSYYEEDIVNLTIVYIGQNFGTKHNERTHILCDFLCYLQQLNENNLQRQKFSPSTKFFKLLIPNLSSNMVLLNIIDPNQGFIANDFMQLIGKFMIHIYISNLAYSSRPKWIQS